jgi:threonine dehydrogenase-like Zn-dependent dehydrogenase
MIQKRLVLSMPERGRVERVCQRVQSLKPDEVLVKTTLAAIKSGTEMTAFCGMGPFQSEQFDPDLRVFQPGSKFFPCPVGNMVIGVVVAVGAAVTLFRPGDQVFAWHGITDYVICRESRLHPLGRLTPEQAVCIDPLIFGLGAACDAEVSRYGKVSFVTGLGPIGLGAIQFLKERGATVYTASAFALRRQLAREYGADEVLDSGTDKDPGLTVKRWTHVRTGQAGVDVAVECSGRYRQLGQAMRATRQCGCVVAAGFYTGEPGADLSREAFHNRLTINVSLPAMRWGNPTRDPELTSNDDLFKHVVASLESGTVSVRGMLQPILPFDQAHEALRLIDEHPEQVVKVGIQF